jgi:secreted trypsin-like serine protease
MNLDENVPSRTGEQLTMMGFGSTTDGVSAPYNSELQLQEAPTEYVAFNDCAVARNPDTGSAFGVTNSDGSITTAVTGDWMCTLKTDPERTATCVGDSGSPIILEGATPDDDRLVASVSG